MRAWVNGQLLSDPTAPAVHDHGPRVHRRRRGLRGGQGASTGSRSRSPATSRASARSAERLGLPVLDDAEVRRGIAAVLDGFDEPLGRLRITYTGGPAPLGSGRGDAAAHPGRRRRAARPSRGRRPARSPCPGRATSAGRWPGVKSTSYAENVVALAYAAERGATEAVFANLRATSARAPAPTSSTSLDGELRTPTLASGCLAGITRALILEWCDAVEVDEPIEIGERARRARSSSPRPPATPRP